MVLRRKLETDTVVHAPLGIGARGMTDFNPNKPALSCISFGCQVGEASLDGKTVKLVFFPMFHDAFLQMSQDERRSAITQIAECFNEMSQKIHNNGYLLPSELAALSAERKDREDH